jgi:hypothetical protein
MIPLGFRWKTFHFPSSEPLLNTFFTNFSRLRPTDGSFQANFTKFFVNQFHSHFDFWPFQATPRSIRVLWKASPPHEWCNNLREPSHSTRSNGNELKNDEMLRTWKSFGSASHLRTSRQRFGLKIRIFISWLERFPLLGQFCWTQRCV